MREIVRDKDRLEHMVEAIDCIFDFSEGKTKEELVADKLKYYGIVKNIEIIGEAAYKLTKVFCRQHPETPWEFITKMRHVLVHDYYQIKPQEVLNVIQDDLRPLRNQIVGYLSDVDWDEWEKNEVAIIETTTHKNQVQTALRMKNDGLSVEQIARYTSLTIEEIDSL